MFAPLGALEVTMRYYKIVLHLLIIAIGMLGCDWDAYSSVVCVGKFLLQIFGISSWPNID